MCVFRMNVSRRWQWNWSSQPAMFVLYVLSLSSSNFLFQDGQFQFRGDTLIIRFGHIPFSAEGCQISMCFTIKVNPQTFGVRNWWELRFLQNQSCYFENSYVFSTSTARLLISSLNTNNLHNILACFGEGPEMKIIECAMSRCKKKCYPLEKINGLEMEIQSERLLRTRYNKWIRNRKKTGEAVTH